MQNFWVVLLPLLETKVEIYFQDDTQKLIIAEDLKEALQEKLGVDLKVIQNFQGSDLEGCTYRHPLAKIEPDLDRVSPVVLGGDYITTDSGTGLVHTAPGHGMEDYQVK